MGRRSGVPETEEDVAKLSLDEVNREIERCKAGASPNGQASQGQMSFFKRLIWMEKMRETIHGIPAERRVWRDR